MNNSIFYRCKFITMVIVSVGFADYNSAEVNWYIFYKVSHRVELSSVLETFIFSILYRYNTMDDGSET